MERRTFLATATATAVGITFASSDAVGTAHLAELREGLRSLFALDDASGSLLGDGPFALRRGLDLAVVAQCAELLGVSAAALDVAVTYVNERE